MWKQIEDLDYEINSEGIVRRISTKRIKKSFKRPDGYIGIQLYVTKDKVLEIRKRRNEEKLSYQKLAEMYSVSYSCIAGIIQRTNWKHI